MQCEFTKMQGCGNDYIYVDAKKYHIDDPGSLSIRISDPHFGIGSDGLILVAPSEVADARMIMFNLDGSEGRMCGNGIRCVAKFVHDHWGFSGDEMTIETKSGIKTIKLEKDPEGNVTGAVVDMGPAELSPEKIPVNISGEEKEGIAVPCVVDRAVRIGGVDYAITCVSMGNPHAVVFVDDVENLDLASIGPKFEKNELFPESVNTEFVKVLGENELRMRVWERGSGETWACGTGTCATVVAACLNGFTKKGEEVLVHLNGGDLRITYTDETVIMKGPAVTVCSGVIELEG